MEQSVGLSARRPLKQVVQHGLRESQGCEERGGRTQCRRLVTNACPRRSGRAPPGRMAAQLRRSRQPPTCALLTGRSSSSTSPPAQRGRAAQEQAVREGSWPPTCALLTSRSSSSTSTIVVRRSPRPPPAENSCSSASSAARLPARSPVRPCGAEPGGGRVRCQQAWVATSPRRRVAFSARVPQQQRQQWACRPATHSCRPATHPLCPALRTHLVQRGVGVLGRGQAQAVELNKLEGRHLARLAAVDRHMCGTVRQYDLWVCGIDHWQQA